MVYALIAPAVCVCMALCADVALATGSTALFGVPRLTPTPRLTQLLGGAFTPTSACVSFRVSHGKALDAAASDHDLLRLRGIVALFSEELSATTTGGVACPRFQEAAHDHARAAVGAHVTVAIELVLTERINVVGTEQDPHGPVDARGAEAYELVLRGQYPWWRWLCALDCLALYWAAVDVDAVDPHPTITTFTRTRTHTRTRTRTRTRTQAAP